jgi:hypothetical protein
MMASFEDLLAEVGRRTGTDRSVSDGIVKTTMLILTEISDIEMVVVLAAAAIQMAQEGKL